MPAAEKPEVYHCNRRGCDHQLVLPKAHDPASAGWVPSLFGAVYCSPECKLDEALEQRSAFGRSSDDRADATSQPLTPLDSALARIAELEARVTTLEQDTRRTE